MKARHAFLIAGALAALTGLGVTTRAQAAQPRHHAVFELNSDNPEVWEAVLKNMENVQRRFGPKNSRLELVAHGGGLGMLLASNQSLAPRMQALTEQQVVFAACENTMRRRNVTRQDLLPFVETVPSGVAEVILKQEAGWAYLKAGF